MWPIEVEATLGWKGIGVGGDHAHRKTPPLPRCRDPWNKGRLTAQKRPLKPKDVSAIRVRLQLEHCKRDLALFNLAIDSNLRGCDLIRLQVNDICVGGQVRDRTAVIQRKTGRPVQFEITEQTRTSIRDWLPGIEVEDALSISEQIEMWWPRFWPRAGRSRAWYMSSRRCKRAIATSRASRPSSQLSHDKAAHTRSRVGS